MSEPDAESLPPGWNEFWSSQWRDADAGGLVPCRVVRIDKGGITVARKSGDEMLVIAAKAVRRVVVGDVCGLDADAGRIEVILPRRTVFERRAPGVDRDQLQVSSRAIASNMDEVYVLQALDAGVNLPRLARELVLAWESGAKPSVILTKSDLLDQDGVEQSRSEAQRFAPGSDVLCISTRVPGGLDELDGHHDPGSVIALLGSSGSGKSSLVNALAGHEVQLVAEVRDSDRRGRHTTTAGQIVELTDGAMVIDTPGIRGVGLWSADDGFDLAFADLDPFVEACRFDDCTHTNEPGCGLLQAVTDGRIGADRVSVWQDLAAELETLEDILTALEREATRGRNQKARRRAQKRDDVETSVTGRSVDFAGDTEEGQGD